LDREKMGQDQRDFQINKKGEARLTGPPHDHEAPHLKRGAADHGNGAKLGSSAVAAPGGATDGLDDCLQSSGQH
jgi:hypothetical protein